MVRVVSLITTEITEITRIEKPILRVQIPYIRTDPFLSSIIYSTSYIVHNLSIFIQTIYSTLFQAITFFSLNVSVYLSPFTIQYRLLITLKNIFSVNILVEKEKILVASISSFPPPPPPPHTHTHNVSARLKNTFEILNIAYLIVCKCFLIWISIFFSFCNGLRFFVSECRL